MWQMSYCLSHTAYTFTPHLYWTIRERVWTMTPDVADVLLSLTHRLHIITHYYWTNDKLIVRSNYNWCGYRNDATANCNVKSLWNVSHLASRTILHKVCSNSTGCGYRNGATANCNVKSLWNVSHLASRIILHKGNAHNTCVLNCLWIS
ncbi:hypothetical protein J6590_083088 [Homalodisca vitripennis]|nr:hypothetical protein J6590_083088 [Homalodisca vitripennis]